MEKQVMALYARVTTTKADPSRLEEAVAYFKERLLPAVEQAPGFVGARLLVDRETGIGTSVTFWDSVGAMNAAEQLARQLRAQSVQASGVEVLDVDRSEILIFDAPAEPVVPLYSRVAQINVPPEKVDAFIDFTKSESHARIRAYPGFRSLVLGVNRMTGRCTISIGFESAEARAASEESGAASRAKVAGIVGAPEPTVTRPETVVARVRAGSPA